MDKKVKILPIYKIFFKEILKVLHIFAHFCSKYGNFWKFNVRFWGRFIIFSPHYGADLFSKVKNGVGTSLSFYFLRNVNHPIINYYFSIDLFVLDQPCSTQWWSWNQSGEHNNNRCVFFSCYQVPFVLPFIQPISIPTQLHYSTK